MSATAPAIRRRIAAFNEAQSNETLLAAWIELTKQMHVTRCGGGPTAARRELAIACDSIEVELIRRGMTSDDFDRLHEATTAACDA